MTREASESLRGAGELAAPCDVGQRRRGQAIPTSKYLIYGSCVSVPLTRGGSKGVGPATSAAQGVLAVPAGAAKGGPAGHHAVACACVQDKCRVQQPFALVLLLVNGHRQIHNLCHLVEFLAKRENSQTLEFQYSCVHLDRAKVGELQVTVRCLCFYGPTSRRPRPAAATPKPKEVLNSEVHILGSYDIGVWCSPVLSPSLAQKAMGR